MEGIGNDRRDLVRSIFEQHLARVRLWEQQRFLATMAVVVIFAATFILVPEFYPPGSVPVLILLEVFALLAFLYSVHLGRRINLLEDAAGFVIHRHSLDHYLPDPAGAQRPFLSPGDILSILLLLLFSGGLVFLLEVTYELPPFWLVLPVGILTAGLILLKVSRPVPKITED